MVNSQFEKALFSSAEFCGRFFYGAHARRQHGFTLIELLITMVIIGILATIAFPAYTGYAQEARRAEAKSILFDAAQMLERCYTAKSDYQNCTDLKDLNKKSIFYTIGFKKDSLTATTYTLAATPKSSQSSDECKTLTLDQAGKRSATGGGDDCW